MKKKDGPQAKAAAKKRTGRKAGGAATGKRTMRNDLSMEIADCLMSLLNDSGEEGREFRAALREIFAQYAVDFLEARG